VLVAVIIVNSRGVRASRLLGRCEQLVRRRQAAQMVQGERDYPVAERPREVAADENRFIGGFATPSTGSEAALAAASEIGGVHEVDASLPARRPAGRELLTAWNRLVPRLANDYSQKC
jgi:hypothetical protein